MDKPQTNEEEIEDECAYRRCRGNNGVEERVDKMASPLIYTVIDFVD